MPHIIRRAATAALMTAVAFACLSACTADTTASASAPSDPKYAAVRDAIALKIQTAINATPGIAGSHVIDSHQADTKDTVSVFVLVHAANASETTEVVSAALSKTWQTIDHIPGQVNVQVFDTKTQSNLDVGSAVRALNIAADSSTASSVTIEAATLAHHLGAIQTPQAPAQ